MMKFLKTKFLPILVGLTLLLFLTNNFGLIDIEKTAIIIALGIDKVENSQKYEVTAQIAVPQATNSSKNNDDALVSGKGATIADAIDDIAVTTGWYPLLAFCNLIVLGENTLKTNVMTFVDEFIRTDKIPDSSLLVACEGKAQDLLTTATPLDSVSAFALEKILVKDIAKLNRISFVNVKDFAKGYFSKSKSSYMPYIKKTKVETAPPVQEGGGGGGGSEGGSGDGSNEKYVFDGTTTLMFKNGVNVGMLDENQTLTFNLRKHESIDTFFDMENIKIGEKTAAATIGLNEVKKRFALEIKDEPVFHIELTIKCHVEDVNCSEEVKDLFTTQVIPDEALRQIENKIEEIYKESFKKMQQSDCDLYSLTDELYKFHYKKYKLYKDDVLQKTSINVKIKCELQRNNRT